MLGVGTGQNAGDHPTATSAFVSQSLQQEIDLQTVDQLAARSQVTVTQSQLDAARQVYETEITQVMAEVAQTAQGQNPAFSCSVTGKPLTGGEILSTLPTSYVDRQVQYIASVTALREHFSGYGSTEAGLLRYYQSHLSAFDTGCFTVAVYASQSDATAAKASVASGTPFSTGGLGDPGRWSAGLPRARRRWPPQLPSSAHLQTLPLNTVSDPIDDNGMYLLVEMTERTHTDFSAVKSLVSQAVQQAGATKTQTALAAVQRHSDISVNPQYGVWVPVPATDPGPVGPGGIRRAQRQGQRADHVGDVVIVGRREPVQRLSVPRLRPHITVVGLGPAGNDLLGAKSAELLAGPSPAFLRTARHPAAAGRRRCADVRRALRVVGHVRDGVRRNRRGRWWPRPRRAPRAGRLRGTRARPAVAERTVELLRADERVDVTVIPALSFLDLAWAALGIDPLTDGVRLVDAVDFEQVADARWSVPGGPGWSRHLLSDMKLTPVDRVEDEPARPVLLHHLGLEDELVLAVDWWELDRTIEPDHLTSVYIPALGAADAAAVEWRARGALDTLREHCPWDQAQTHASLMPHLVEESYEVLDALARRSMTPRLVRRRRYAPSRRGAGRPALPDRLPRQAGP